MHGRRARRGIAPRVVEYLDDVNVMVLEFLSRGNDEYSASGRKRACPADRQKHYGGSTQVRAL